MPHSFESDAYLFVDGEKINFPVTMDSVGNKILSTRKLCERNKKVKDPKVVFSDIGLEVTSPFPASKISFVADTLYYHGIPIDQLVEKSSFIETIYLLLTGELPPSAEHLQTFEQKIVDQMSLNDNILALIKCLPKQIHPLTLASNIASALSAYAVANDDAPLEQQNIPLRLISIMPTVLAANARLAQGLPFVSPRSDMGYVENYLNMLFQGTPHENDIKNPAILRAMNRYAIIHAEHTFNASTTAMAQALSAGVDPYLAFASGLNTLGGALHGGASERALRMHAQIGSPERVPLCIEEMLRDKDGHKNNGLIPGVGHRIYGRGKPDVRVRHLKNECLSVQNTLGKPHRLLDIAQTVEEKIIHDPYFVERGLCCNVDFYSGVLLSQINVVNPSRPEGATAAFAFARTIGLASHMLELFNDKKLAIVRPFQISNSPIYGDAPVRTYVPQKMRSSPKSDCRII